MARKTVSNGEDFTAFMRDVQRRIDVLERRTQVAAVAVELDRTIYPYARVYDSDGQTILNSTNTGIAFDTELYDPYGMHAANSGDLIAPVSGWYSCSYVGVIPPAAGGIMAYWMDLDGIGGFRWGQEQNPFHATQGQGLSGCEDIFMEAGQKLMLGCFQNSGGAVAFGAGCVLQAVLRRATEVP